MAELRTLNVIAIDDEHKYRLAIKSLLEDTGAFRVNIYATGKDAIADKQTIHEADIAIIDQEMPDLDGFQTGMSLINQNPRIFLIMLTAYGTVEKADRAMGDFKFHAYIKKPLEIETLDQLLSGPRMKKHMTWRQQVSEREKNLAPKLIGVSESVKKLRKTIMKIGLSGPGKPILILGQPGTGKEVVARAIHHSMFGGKSSPFMGVSSSMPIDLFESELYGHEKGVFPGAEKKEGLFEKLKGGTLLLDDIQTMSWDHQGKLLRALQEKRSRRVGSSKEYEIDLQLIMTINIDPQKAIQEKKLRGDLYYRSGTHIILFPLRKRKEDIPLLVEHFIAMYQTNPPKILSNRLLKEIINFPWIGNVRQLENSIARAMSLSDGSDLDRSYIFDNNDEIQEAFQEDWDHDVYDQTFDSDMGPNPTLIEFDWDRLEPDLKIFMDISEKGLEEKKTRKKMWEEILKELSIIGIEWGKNPQQFSQKMENRIAKLLEIHPELKAHYKNITNYCRHYGYIS